MITIKLLDRECVLYKGCTFATPADLLPENNEKNHFRMFRNALDYYEKFPIEERDTLLVIGDFPPWIKTLIFFASYRFFKDIRHNNPTGEHIDSPSSGPS